MEKDIKCDYQKGTYKSVTHLNLELGIPVAGSTCLLVVPTPPVTANSLFYVTENLSPPQNAKVMILNS